MESAEAEGAGAGAETGWAHSTRGEMQLLHLQLYAICICNFIQIAFPSLSHCYVRLSLPVRLSILQAGVGISA